jgi:hypothetical protein
MGRTLHRPGTLLAVVFRESGPRINFGGNAWRRFLVATTSVFALPAYFMEHARRDFRAAILADPDLRSALEAMALVWTDPVGYREFGPL